MHDVKNYMEELVEQYLDETLEMDTAETIAVRSSHRLRAQALALALNNIPPFYVTGKTGEVYGFSNGAVPQHKADIMVEIMKAIEFVVQKGYN